MGKIKSTTATVFESIFQESGTIVIEINSPVNDVLANTTRCNINYFHLETSRLISSDTWNLPKAKSDMLLTMQINGDDPQIIDNTLAQFLLEKVQSELINDAHTIFNLMPGNWQLSDDNLGLKQPINNETKAR